MVHHPLLPSRPSIQSSHLHSHSIWAFMLSEACIRVYLPTMSRLRGETVDEKTRVTVYGLMQLSFNGYVLLILAALSAGQRCGWRKCWEGTKEGVCIFYVRLLLIGIAPRIQKCH